MAPTDSPAERERVGPHPSHIEVAKPYLFQSRIDQCLTAIGMTDAKEDAVRLQGVAWIDQVRRALNLPVRTFNTAVIYYHKFRLLRPDTEYNWADAAAAALFTACKIEDTLKKSREILCANWNLKVPPSESLSSDDPRFDSHSKLIIGLERLMLESAGFDFRSRYPQDIMVKIAKGFKFDQNTYRTAFNLSIDQYRTFAPLKQGTTTLAIACIELAARLHEMDMTKIVDTGAARYKVWATSRAEVMETLLDMLDLYTHHRASTSVGPLYSLETFINIRIVLNKEAAAANIPRYTLYASEAQSDAKGTTNGLKPRNGIDPTSPLTPATPGTSSPSTNQAPTSALGQRGQSGTVRFMTDAARARDEREQVAKYYRVEEEEYEVEVPNDARPDDRDKRGKGYRRTHDEDRDSASTDNDRMDQDDTLAPSTGKSTYWERRAAAQKAKLSRTSEESDYQDSPRRGAPVNVPNPKEIDSVNESRRGPIQATHGRGKEEQRRDSSAVRDFASIHPDRIKLLSLQDQHRWHLLQDKPHTLDSVPGLRPRLVAEMQHWEPPSLRMEAGQNARYTSLSIRSREMASEDGDDSDSLFIPEGPRRESGGGRGRRNRRRNRARGQGRGRGRGGYWV